MNKKNTQLEGDVAKTNSKETFRRLGIGNNNGSGIPGNSSIMTFLGSLSDTESTVVGDLQLNDKKGHGLNHRK